MSKLDAIEHDDGHRDNILVHLYDFYQWVAKNCPEVYQKFLKSGKEG